MLSDSPRSHTIAIPVSSMSSDVESLVGSTMMPSGLTVSRISRSDLALHFCPRLSQPIGRAKRKFCIAPKFVNSGTQLVPATSTRNHGAADDRTNWRLVSSKCSAFTRTIAGNLNGRVSMPPTIPRPQKNASSQGINHRPDTSALVRRDCGGPFLNRTICSPL